MNAKHFYIIPSALLLSTVCHAQIVKGDKLLGGSIGFVRANTNNYGNGSISAPYNSVNFSLSYGKAVKNNTVLGVNTSFGYSNQNTVQYDAVNGTVSTNNKMISGGAGIFKRRYVPLGKDFYFFGQMGATLNYGRSNSANTVVSPSGMVTYQKDISTTGGINLYLYPGFSYQLNNRFMLDISLGNLLDIGYSSTVREVQGLGKKPAIDVFYLNSNLSLNSLGNVSVGFRVLFHNKKSNKKTAS
jgi:hypothetical protein